MGQPIVTFCEESESAEWLQSELPLAFRLRRSWSCGDIWDLRHLSADDVSPQSDKASLVGDALNDPIKFIDDSASTCDDDGNVSLFDVETEMGDCSEPTSPTLTWAEQMEDSISPKNWTNPPGIWAMPSESFAMPPGQWTGALGKLSCPPGNVGAPPGIFSAFASPPAKLTGPPGNLFAPPGNFIVSTGVAAN